MAIVNLKSFNKFRLFFFLGVLLCAVCVLAFLPRLTIPLGISYVSMLVLRPIKPIFVRASTTKKIVLIIGILCLFILFLYPFTEAIYAIQEESQNVQQYLQKFEFYADNVYKKLQQQVLEMTGFRLSETDFVKNFVTEVSSGFRNIVLSLPKYLASVLEWSFIIPLFLFFMLKDGKAFRHLFLKIVPNDYFERTYNLVHQFNKKFGDYIFAKFMEASILGLIITIGLVIIGYPFAVLLGLVAAISNVIPYLGPFIGIAPAIVIGLVDQSNASMGAMLILYIVANIVDLALIFPIMVSKVVNLHPMLVVTSVIIGSQFMGVVGMVISIPMAALVQLLFLEIYKEIYPSSLQE